jgi:hypothetical protein
VLILEGKAGEGSTIRVDAAASEQVDGAGRLVLTVSVSA